jgi:hypothetical protein
MTKTRSNTKARSLTVGLTAGLAGLALMTVACSGQSSASTSTQGANGSGLSNVMFMGDSTAVDEALALTPAFKASGVGFQSIAEDGGGNVLGPFSDMNWKTLPGHIASAKPTVFVYQITNYDWGSQQQQQAAYQKLLTTGAGDGAKLIFVTMPPINPPSSDDFYQPHMADLARTTAAAQAVAAGSSGKAVVLDASAVWGTTFQQDKDGKPDRSSDGIHPCPQGAARFANWLLGQLAKLYPGFTPARAQNWANTGWSGSSRFKGC